MKRSAAWLTAKLRSWRGVPDHPVTLRWDRQRITGNPARMAEIQAIYRWGSWEYEVTKCFNALVKPGMTVVDVGANLGYYTLLAARRVGPSGRVIAFEPIPEARRRLEENLALNGYRNVTISPVALFSRDTPMVLGRPFEDSRLLPETRHPSDGDLEVTCARFDAIRQDVGIGAVDVVKMDVEGAEMDVLLGMTETLSRSRPSLLLEVHASALTGFGHTAAHVTGWLQDLGYVLTPLDMSGSDFHAWLEDGRTETVHLLAQAKERAG